MEILDIKDLTFSYPGSDENAIENVSFSLDKGDFLALCGGTGSGKTTLARLIKRELAPGGKLSGSIRINGREQSGLSERESAFSVGYVMQSPEQQIVTDKVWHELAFGLENMGVPNGKMKRMIAETASFFGIEEWFDKDVSELSGGQKQLLCLASVMVTDPDILILDEPTSQLDPIAASEFISTVCRLNRELSLTVIMIEHRLEEVIPVSNKLLALDRGRAVVFGDTGKAAAKLPSFPDLLEGMPSALRLWSVLKDFVPNSAEIPLTNTEGRAFMENNFGNTVRSLPKEEYTHSGEKALEVKGVYMRYSRDRRDALRGADLTVYKGEILCVMGGNGSGKSTLLSCCAGVRRPYAGQIKVFGKRIKDCKNGTLYKNNVALLPQDVQTVFLKESVREELLETKEDISGLPFDISSLADRHPYDLSGGEMQLAALAKVLMTKPKLLLLDEPTKGLDAHTRNIFTDILRKLKEQDVTVVIVTHDIEFASGIADRCAMLFRGQVASVSPAADFFPDSSYYTSAASRMSRGYYDRVINTEQLKKLCLMNIKDHDSD